VVDRFAGNGVLRLTEFYNEDIVNSKGPAIAGPLFFADNLPRNRKAMAPAFPLERTRQY
jgi:hypothetical protein